MILIVLEFSSTWSSSRQGQRGVPSHRGETTRDKRLICSINPATPASHSTCLLHHFEAGVNSCSTALLLHPHSPYAVVASLPRHLTSQQGSDPIHQLLLFKGKLRRCFGLLERRLTSSLWQARQNALWNPDSLSQNTKSTIGNNNPRASKHTHSHTDIDIHTHTYKSVCVLYLFCISTVRIFVYLYAFSRICIHYVWYKLHSEAQEHPGEVTSEHLSFTSSTHSPAEENVN